MRRPEGEASGRATEVDPLALNDSDLDLARRAHC